MAIDDVIDGLMAAATHDVTFPIYLFGTVGKVMLWAAEATHDVTFPTYLFGTVGKMTSWAATVTFPTPHTCLGLWEK